MFARQARRPPAAPPIATPAAPRPLAARREPVAGRAWDFSRVPVWAAARRDGPAPATVTPDRELSGTVPDVVTPPEGGRPTTSSAADASAAAAAAGAGVPVVARLALRLSHPRIDRPGGGGKADPVASGVTMGNFTQPAGRAVPAEDFGGETYEPSFHAINFAFSGGKCTVTARLDIACPWGTQSLGRTDVPSATDPVVTARNWRAIVADLKPRAASPFDSRRDKFYSQALVERHEKFHGTDDNAWTAATGFGVVKTFLEAATIARATGPSDVARPEGDVSALFGSALGVLVAANKAYYTGGGKAHHAMAGEVRAYADGRAAYQDLADAVTAQGATFAPPPPPARRR